MNPFKKSPLLYLIVSSATLLPACQRSQTSQDADKALASLVSSRSVSAEKYVLDKKESVVTWKCSMAFADKGGHQGYVYLSKGELMIEKDQLVGGTVDVDMNTIEDERHDSNNNLVDHLKDPDFFDVKKFPVSTFTITRIAGADGKNKTITGNLTIKGITRVVSFPAQLEINETTITANGKVTIDRTLWDVRYKSGKFFASVADEAISDNIEFAMKIVAKKEK